MSESASKVRRQLRRLWTEAYAAEMPGTTPTRPWRRKTPRREGEIKATRRTLSEVFGRCREYRFKYPAGRKARRVIENRGLRVHEIDETAMRKHRRDSGAKR